MTWKKYLNLNSLYIYYYFNKSHQHRHYQKQGDRKKQQTTLLESNNWINLRIHPYRETYTCLVLHFTFLPTLCSFSLSLFLTRWWLQWDADGQCGTRSGHQDPWQGGWGHRSLCPRPASGGESFLKKLNFCTRLVKYG